MWAEVPDRRHRLLWASRVGWLILIGAVSSTAACGTPSGGFAELDAMEEADLALPDSHQLADGGYDAEVTVEGRLPAATWTIYGTTADISDVKAYFDKELADRGWEEAPGIPSTSQLEALLWRRGNLAVQLGILDVEEWHQRIEGSDEYPTMYEVRVSERRNADR